MLKHDICILLCWWTIIHHHYNDINSVKSKLQFFSISCWIFQVVVKFALFNKQWDVKNNAIIIKTYIFSFAFSSNSLPQAKVQYCSFYTYLFMMSFVFAWRWVLNKSMLCPFRAKQRVCFICPFPAAYSYLSFDLPVSLFSFRS